MRNQAFGIEIELTGITREQAAKEIAGYFGTTTVYEGGAYYTYRVKDEQGRDWKVMRDSSISPERKATGRTVTADDNYKVEVVSPKCGYADIETIQELVRRLRKAGAIANSSCGIHIHIDASNHNAKTLRNLVNIMASKQDLIYKALRVDYARESRYCKKVKDALIEKLNKAKPTAIEKVADIWYEGYYGSRNVHYHDSRYHGLNLHSTFSKGTVEFRFFNSTTHAGKIKAYIQFCLAINHQAIIQKSASAKKTETDNPKYTFRTWLLRLGLIGNEFSTARKHLLANLEGDIAWRHAA